MFVMKSLIISVFILLLSNAVFCFQLPTSLNGADQKKMQQIVGFGSATKYVTRPEPFTLNESFELSVSQEFVPLENVTRLGTRRDERIWTRL